MRATVKVIGMGDRITGKNKGNGNPYDFRKVAFSFVNSFGSNDVSVNNVDGSVLDDLEVQVGREFKAVVNQVNRTYYIDLIEPA